MCPSPQDLRRKLSACCELTEGYSNWRLRPFVLKGGLTLLSRLRYLERLRVDYSYVECEIAALSWLCHLGRNEEHRARRCRLVDGWTRRL